MEEVRRELFERLRDEIWTRQLSNSEGYDKAVFSLATAFLGFSLAFLKDFVPYQAAVAAWLLPASWILFAAAVVATILSFFTSQHGLATRLADAEKYYLEGKEEFFNRHNVGHNWTSIFNLGSASSFVLAILTTILFVIFNLSGGHMSKNQKLERGTPVPLMQKVPGSPFNGAVDGAPVPTMQKVPQPTGGTPPASSGGGTGTPSGK